MSPTAKQCMLSAYSSVDVWADAESKRLVWPRIEIVRSAHVVCNLLIAGVNMFVVDHQSGAHISRCGDLAPTSLPRLFTVDILNYTTTTTHVGNHTELRPYASKNILHNAQPYPNHQRASALHGTQQYQTPPTSTHSSTYSPKSSS